MIGRRLGHFTILERLGAGAMGEVYRARDEHLQRDVALKVLPPAFLTDDEARARFRRGALALSPLNHPHLASIFEFGHDHGLDYLVMELVDGPTLEELLARGPLAEEHVLRYGIQLASGLEAAHARGVVHRDIKLANLRLTKDGQLKILDFGLARLAASQTGSTVTAVTTTGFPIGTPACMAPELIRGERADERADLYATGVVLYELISGRPPFRDPNTAALLYSIINTPPADPAGASPGLTAVLHQLLAKNPAQRYSSAAELRADLARLQHEEEPRARRTRPRRVLQHAVTVAGILAVLAGVAWLTIAWRNAHGDLKSVAVLPLVNLSNDPAQEYFADGMTEELIAELSQVSAISVTARGSIMPYKGTHKPLSRIAHELGVEALVEGSVQRAEGRVRVTAELVEGHSSRALWARTYDEPMAGVLTLQDRITRAVVDGIRARLTPREVARLSAQHLVDPRAYDEYLQGRYELARATQRGWSESIAHQRRALAIDPHFAQAEVALAESYYLMSSFYVSPDSAMPQVRAAVRRALDIDPANGDAHALQGVVDAQYEWDFPRAESEYRQALESAPSSTDAHEWYGYLLYESGRFDEARVHLETVERLDPSSTFARWFACFPDFLQGRYAAAETRLRALAAVDTTYAPTYSLLGETLELEGRYAEALNMLDRGLACGGNLWLRAGQARIHARMGERDRAREILGECRRRTAHGDFLSPYIVATVYGCLGERDSAYAWIEDAVRERDENALLFSIDPRVAPLRGDPRFDALVRRIGVDGRKPAAAPTATRARQPRHERGSRLAMDVRTPSSCDRW